MGKSQSPRCSNASLVIVLETLMLSFFSAVAWATPIAKSQPLVANGTKECFGLWYCIPELVRDYNCVYCTSINDSCIKCAPGYALVPKKVWSRK
jgi:hypothetical protein